MEQRIHPSVLVSEENANVKAVNSGIKMHGMKGTIPSTGIIGRSLLGKENSLLFFLNPLFDVDRGVLNSENLASKIYLREKQLRILNVACGGCADIPLFQELLENAVGNACGKSPLVEIINVDLSDKVIEGLKEGIFPYFNLEAHEFYLIKDSVNAKIKAAKDKYFIPTKCKVRKHDETYVEIEAYRMRKEVSDSLKVQQVDAKKIPFPDNTFDITIVHYLIDYLTIRDKLKVRNEVVRVTKDNGFVFPNYAVYQKMSDRVRRFSGYSSKNGKPEKGLLPTVQRKTEYFPFSLERWDFFIDYPDGHNGYERLNYDRLFEGKIIRNSHQIWVDSTP